ncbi:MAG: DUF6701 domain-containing protein [Xanthomonadales bacterium]|nr:DUF6701 domain-containing protein [Xanthomonadales bacterium]
MTIHRQQSAMKWHVVILCALLSLNLTALAQDTITITEPGNGQFEVPDNVYEITVEVWGGGGRGGNRSNPGGSGGGGGGAYSRSVLAVTPGEMLQYRVGAGSTSGGQGGDTWFSNNSILLARGGESVSNNSAGGQGASAGSGVGDVRYSGGNGADGSGGANGGGGGGGSSAGANQDGSPGSGTSGGTAPPGGGDGGDGGTGFFFGQDGAPGTQPGGGGGGATRGVFFGGGDGGPGANGQVVITYEELEVPPAEIEAEWRMDEAEWDGTSGEIVDSSGNDNNATAQTGGTDNSLPNTAPGKVCRAGRFRGQGFAPDDPPPFYVDAQHYAETADDPSLSPLDGVGAMSTGGWFKLETTGGTLIHKGEGGNSQEYRVFVDGSQLKLTLWNRFGSPSTMTISNQALQLDTWYFFAATAYRLPSGNDIRVDGYLYDESGQIGSSSQQTLNVDYTNKDTSGRFFFGGISYGATPTDYFEGLLDEIRVYSGILEPSEIDDFWANTRPCPDFTQLLLEYRFEQSSYDGTSGEVEDTSGNDRNGTTSGDAESEFDDPAIPGNPGTCRYTTFEASGDFRNGGYIQSPGLSQLLNDTATMTFWIRTTQTSDNTEAWRSPGIAGIEDEGGTDDIFWGWIDQAGRIGMSVGNDFSADQKSTTPINNGTWRHVALTWDRDSGDTEIYIDGALDQTGNTGNGDVIGNSFSGIGRIENTNPGIDPYYFDGELDEVRVYGGVLSAGEIAAIRDETWQCDIGYDHIRLHHPETGLTCSPASILVEACADPDCSSLYDGTVEIDFTSPSSNWTPDPVSFDGSVNVTLQYTTPGTVTLNASAIEPAASNAVQCLTPGGPNPGCEMEFFESGFMIDIPDHVADTVVNGTIEAVRADPGNPEQCVPGFDDRTEDISFWSQYFNPSSGSLQVNIDGNPIATTSPGTTSPIAFDGNGVGSFQLQYPDVGNVAVNAEYIGSGQDAGLVMTGQGQFVARPARFTLDIPGNPAATDDDGEIFTTAGSDFEITVAARNASDGVTPNFGQESSPESVDLELGLFAPSGGVDPGLAGSFGEFAVDCDGNNAAAGTACGEFAWPEVGIVSLTPQLASGAYLGTVDVVGTQIEHVGRFIPNHFQLSNPQLIDRAAIGCSSSPFTYFGERFDASFTVFARTATGAPTQNYQGVFAFLDGSELSLSETSGPELQVTNPSVGVWMAGSASAGAKLSIARVGPEPPVENYLVTADPIDDDGVALQNPPGNIGSTELRFGRIVIDNAIGSELGPLELPWRTEYWDGSTWLTNADDNCTALALVDDLELTSSGGASGDGTTPMSVGGGSTSIDEAESELTLGSGVGSIHFTAPGSPGWVNVLLGLDTNWPYLRDELDDDSDTPYEENPEARATFGLFDGNSQRIYIREIAPQ